MQLFQFLYTFLKQLNKSSCFVVIRTNCNKIFRSIIISNAIKMMNKPSFRQSLMMMLFPNISMLSYSSIFSSSWITKFINLSVALAVIPSLPVLFLIKAVYGRVPNLITLFCSATPTSNRPFSYRFFTIKAVSRWPSPFSRNDRGGSLRGAATTTYSLASTRFSAIHTGVFK